MELFQYYKKYSTSNVTALHVLLCYNESYEGTPVVIVHIK
jgi:hypothetical protein